MVYIREREREKGINEAFHHFPFFKFSSVTWKVQCSPFLFFPLFFFSFHQPHDSSSKNDAEQTGKNAFRERGTIRCKRWLRNERKRKKKRRKKKDPNPSNIETPDVFPIIFVSTFDPSYRSKGGDVFKRQRTGYVRLKFSTKYYY